MAQKPKARSSPDKAGAAAKQKTQSERFIKAAREFGVDETGKDFELAMKRIAPPKRANRRGSKGRAAENK